MISSVKGCTKIASVEKGVQMLKTVIAEASGGHEEFKKELIKIRDAHVTGHRFLIPETWNDMASLMAVCYMSNEANHILCPGCLEETPRCISICLNCQGTLISHDRYHQEDQEANDRRSNRKECPQSIRNQSRTC